MPVYLDLVILLNFFVDFFLLLGTNRLAGYPACIGRAAAAAALGGIYGGVCLIPGFGFLGNTFWRTVSLGLMGILAFGVDRGTLRRCVLFVLLSMALGGIALGLGSGNWISLLLAAGAVTAMCILGFGGKAGARRYLPVVLEHGGRRVALTALHDTGNNLRDPLTGESVLVVGRKTAWALCELTAKDLQDPVAIVALRPGFRLIPYQAVGKANGMLLCLRVERGIVNGRKQRLLVAFAAEGLGDDGVFDGLIGGNV